MYQAASRITVLRGSATLMVMLLAIAGCSLLPFDFFSFFNPINNPPGDELKSPESRELDPHATNEQVAQIVAGNTRFAFDFYRQVAFDSDANLFFSPYSISLALAMTYAGAAGSTEIEMAQTLHFAPQAQLHPALNALDLELGADTADAEQFLLEIVNSIWGQKNYSFKAQYLDVLAINYGAGIFRVDFQSQPERCRNNINTWVSGKTRGRIEDLLPPGSIGSLTRLVLTNAIYFKADWLHQFEKEDTNEAPFYLLDDSAVEVSMMSQTQTFNYAEESGYYQAIELPYSGETLSMVIILARDGRFAELQRDIDAEFLATLVASLQGQPVVLSLPRTTFEWGESLRDTLSAMGMPTAFTSQADSSGIDGTRNLFISDVIHKAFVAIDEEGTEAAAATAVIMELTAMPVGIRMNVNRPFVFLIRERQTGTVFFLGHVLNPRG